MRQPERRIDRARRRIIDLLEDPILILFARGEKRPKEIAFELVRFDLERLRREGREADAERLFKAKVRWVERRIMGAL
jgi:hypothetical protein